MKWGLFLAIFFLNSFVFAGEDSDIHSTCEWFSLNKKFAYCIHSQITSNNPDVIYYFHGAGGNEKEYLKKWKEFRAEWRAMGIPMPRVVSINFGPIWILAEKNKKSTSSLFDYFIDGIMPFLETKMGGVTGRRLILSMSMGGFNATQLVMKKPELFDKVVLACPAILPLSPFAKKEEVQEFLTRSGAKKSNIWWGMFMQRIFHKDKEDWDQSNPLLLAKTKLGAQTPPLYITCGDTDEFGFFEGSESFARLAQEARVPSMTWVRRTGKHCDRDNREVARFLQTP
ncbi:MAG: alpha/beta hydrolase-fold protein [Bdellovibrionales bacterium]